MSHIKRIGIVGSSSTGKTKNLYKILKLLDKVDGEIIICSNTGDIQQKTYREQIKKGLNKNDIDIYNDIPTVEFLKDEDNKELLLKSKQNLIIFDDLYRKQQTQIIPFFTYSRHLNLSAIIIHQKWTDIELVIRENLNMIVIHRMNNGYDNIWHSIKMIFDGDKKKFDNLMKRLVVDKFGAYVIDLETWKIIFIK